MGWGNLPAGAVQPQPAGGAGSTPGTPANQCNWKWQTAYLPGKWYLGSAPNAQFQYSQFTPPSAAQLAMAGNGNCHVFTSGGANWPMIGPFIGIGPFDTQAEAQAAAQACCVGTPQTQGGGSGPPIPTGGSTPPPPTGGGSQGAGTWLVCGKNYAGGAFRRYLTATSADEAMRQVEGAVKAQGPFVDFNEASTWFRNNPDWCNIDAVAAPAPCDLKSLLTCPPFPANRQGFGIPGSAEWCKTLDSVVADVGAVGNQLFKFIDDLLNVKTRIDNIDDYIKTTTDGVIVKDIVRLIRQIFCWLGPYIETLRTAISCTKQWVASLFPKCNTESLFGLLVIRHFLFSLEKVEWGTDAAVWVVATSGIAIDPLMTTLDYLIRYACPVELMAEGEALEAFKHNAQFEPIARCILQAHGKQFDTMWPAILARGDKPGWRELVQYLRRTDNNDGRVDAALRNLGIIDDGYRQVLETVYDELPSIGDHLEWLRKNVFDGDYVRDFKLMDGFEEKFWPAFGPDLRSQGMRKQDAEHHYAAHWLNPSFSQQFEMVQRLRPGRVDPSIVFTRNDLLRTMQEMDVGVYFRERLERVSHPVPNLTLCLQMYQFGTVQDAEFIEMLKDLGYDDANAGKILSAQIIKVRRLNASSGHGWTSSALASAYAVGKLGADQVRAEMLFLGYSQDDAERLMRRAEIELAISPIRRIQQQSIRSALSTQESAYKCGAIDQAALLSVYKNAGIPNNVAAIAAANVDSEVAVGLCGQQIGSFRSALLKGKVTVDQMRELMLNSGIPPLRVEQYLKSWVIEAQMKGPSATAAQILRWVGTGLLDRETAGLRLLNLGWTDPDLTLLLAESSAKLGRYQAALQKQAAKSQQGAAKAALAMAREAESTARQLRSRLRGIASIATLKKWYVDGLIDDAMFLEYAIARGYPEPEASRYLADAQLAKNKPAKKPKAKPAPGVQGNGTAQGTTPPQP